MKHRILLFAVCMAGFASASAAQEDDDEEHIFALGDLIVEHPWVRAASAGDDTLMFFETENEGPVRTLVSAYSEDAGSVEIVGLMLNGDRIDMVPVGPIEIPEGTFEFDPGGLGLAVHDLTETLTVGAELHVTLVFEDGAELELHVLVEAADAMFHSHNH